MKILISSDNLKLCGASQVAYTLCRTFNDIGHNCYVHTLLSGKMSIKLKDFIVDTVDDVYDIIICLHRETLEYIKSLNVSSTIVYFSQITFELYQSKYISERIRSALNTDILDGVDVICTFSEKSNEILLNMGVDSSYIPQPIYLKDFPKVREGTGVLCTTRSLSVRDMVADICERHGFRFNYIYPWNYGFGHVDIEGKVDDIFSSMKSYRTIVGSGRSILEGMSMGKKVIVYDSRYYHEDWVDGFVTEDNVDMISKHNFSGRCFKYSSSFEFLEKSILESTQSDSDWESNWISENNNSIDSCNKILSLTQRN